MNSQNRHKGLILSALFAAFISASCFIQIPLPGGIPIIIQDMMVMLSGMLLGPWYGLISVIIFLFLGCLGLPVFSGKGGIQHIISGPTSGFLIFYAIGAFVAGLLLSILLSNKKQHSKLKSIIIISIVAIITTALIFAGGILGFMRVTGSNLTKTLAAVLIPFIPGNTIKIILMVPLTYKFRPIIAKSMS